jgi:hypothetical protein
MTVAWFNVTKEEKKMVAIANEMYEKISCHPSALRQYVSFLCSRVVTVLIAATSLGSTCRASVESPANTTDKVVMTIKLQRVLFSNTSVMTVFLQVFMNIGLFDECSTERKF